MKKNLIEFQKYRKKMNQKILDSNNLDIKRFFALDSSVYRKGSLDVSTKELLGLVSSTVLCCNDCILYHLDRCIQEGITDEQLYETFSIALVIGGSIVIPYIRYAFEMMEKIHLDEK